jgi:hypothetical protein
MKYSSLVSLAAAFIGLSGCVAYPMDDHGGHDRGAQRDRGRDQERDHRDDNRDRHEDCDPRVSDCSRR